MTQDANSLAGRSLMQVGLTCRDLERAKVFYRDVLGLAVPVRSERHVVLPTRRHAPMVGLEHTKGQPLGGSILYFDAPDIHTLGAALEAKGVKFGGPAHVLQRTAMHELMLLSVRRPGRQCAWR